MPEKNRWLLPEGVDELLPQQAQRIERWRRQLLDIFQTWGYEFVIPPLIEYLESLLTGVGNDLALDTFKLVDPHSGRLLGIRADMTPQVARIEANRLVHDKPVRLCYIDSVLRARINPTSITRTPIQVGAELYGHLSIDSDFEIMSLMLECLSQIGVDDIYIDIGHVGLYRALSRHAGLRDEDEKHLFDALQRKAIPEINNIIADWKLDPDLGDAFRLLTELNGEQQVLDQAEKHLGRLDPEVAKVINELRQFSNMVNKYLPQYKLHYDLAELRGYSYHTGIVFAAYVPGYGQEIAKGGRYDNIGEDFGRGRPATGFSSDLNTISALLTEDEQIHQGIFAPYFDENSQKAAVQKLRNQGEIVICELPGQKANAKQMNCDRILTKIKNDWVVEFIES